MCERREFFEALGVLVARGDLAALHWCLDQGEAIAEEAYQQALAAYFGDYRTPRHFVEVDFTGQVWPVD